MFYSFKDSNINRQIDLRNIKNRLENLKSDLQIYQYSQQLICEDKVETDPNLDEKTEHKKSE